MTQAATKVGRKPGSLGEGSLTARLLALEVNEHVLMPDLGTHPHGNYSITIKRAKVQDSTSDWKLETCSGFALNMESKPFKFYRITRVK